MLRLIIMLCHVPENLNRGHMVVLFRSFVGGHEQVAAGSKKDQKADEHRFHHILSTR